MLSFNKKMNFFLYLAVIIFAVMQLASAQFTVPSPKKSESASKYCTRIFQGKTCLGTEGYQAFCANGLSKPNQAQAQNAWNQYADLCQKKIQMMMATGNPTTIQAAQQLAAQNGIQAGRSANTAKPKRQYRRRNIKVKL